MAHFKKTTRKRNYRQRGEDEREEEKASDASGGEEGEEGTGRLPSVLSDIRDLQRMRDKSHGLSAAELALGSEIPKELQMICDDPFKLKTGGIVHIKAMRRSQLDAADIEDGIKQQFSKESHLRDEDEEMRKFVEEEMAKRSGKVVAATKSDTEKSSQSTFVSAEEKLMQIAADKLKRFHSKSSDEMLSSTMLSGIPEVDLGISNRMANIEDTERKKRMMLEEVMNKKRNLAMDNMFKQDAMKNQSQKYLQHTHFYMEETTDLGQDDWRDKKATRTNTDIRVVVTDDSEESTKQDSKGRSQPSQGSSKSIPVLLPPEGGGLVKPKKT